MLQDLRTIDIATGIVRSAALVVQHLSIAAWSAAFQVCIVVCANYSTILERGILTSYARAHLQHAQERRV